MQNLFYLCVDMSLSASYMILAVLIMRLLLKKIPKSLTYVMWGLIGLKLCIPFTIDSIFSFLPSSEKIATDLVLLQDVNVQNHLSIYASLQTVCMCIWILGSIALCIYTIYTYIQLKQKVAVSILVEENVFACDYIDTPFILGVFHPCIYVPTSISFKYLEHVLMHEKSHLIRKDHIWKFIAYLLLILHWMNPLVWLAFIQFEKDLEMACDEKVIMDMRIKDKKEYCTILLEMSSQNKHSIFSYPLAFGEVAIKQRVKNVSKYRKMSLIQPTIFALVFLYLTCICFSSTLDSNDLIKINSMHAGNKEVSIYKLLYKPLGNINVSEMNNTALKANDRVCQLNNLLPFLYNSNDHVYKYYLISSITFKGENGENFNVSRGYFNDFYKKAYLKKENDALSLIIYDGHSQTIEYSIETLKEVDIEYIR